jgi:peptidoglycan/xylan/chitin deacetylase (PgdA/CDA1 family)
VPPSQKPPGGLTVAKTPVFVSIGWDDNGKSEGVNWVVKTLKDHKNSDGSAAHNTFYLTAVYGTGWQSESSVLTKQAWHAAMLAGHEIGNHTVTHLPGHGGQNFSVEQWRTEIKGANDKITQPFDPNEDKNTPNDSKGIGMDLTKMYGFRTPYLESNDNALIVLDQLGFKYDCSLEEGFQEDQDGTNYLFPYTLDGGSPGHDLVWNWNEPPVKGPVKEHPGLWELPVYAVIVPPDSVADKYGFAPGLRARVKANVPWFETESAKITGFDYNIMLKGSGGAGMSGPEYAALLKYNLDLRLQGNHAPMLFGAHPDYYVDSWNSGGANTGAERRKAIEDFIAYATSKKEVRVVSHKELMDWMGSPKALP